MKIKVTWGTGTGNTLLSSFDSALFDAGIANYNLIPLSSVIPPKSKIEVKKINLQESKKDFGKRLYVVLSRNCTAKKDASIFAGVGWVMNEKEQKGLFVEHHGESEKEVETLIKKSLTDMTVYRKDSFGEINMKITGIKCTGKPVSALVCAVYKVSKW